MAAILASIFIFTAQAQAANRSDPFTDEVKSGGCGDMAFCQQTHPTSFWQSGDTWYKNGATREYRIALHHGDQGIESSAGRTVSFNTRPCDNLAQLSGPTRHDVPATWTWFYGDIDATEGPCFRISAWVDPAVDLNGWWFGWGWAHYDGMMDY